MNKRLKQVSGILLMATIITTMPQINIISNAQENVSIEKSNSNYDILDQALDVKFFSTNSSGEPNLNSGKHMDLNNFNVQDGFYMVDKGYGWVRSEEDFLQDGYAYDGDSVNISSSHTSSSTHKTSVSIGVGIKTPTIESMIKATYSHQWTNSETVSTGFTVKASEDKQAYVKVYSTSRRFDTVEVKNGQVVNVVESYAPAGTWAKTIEFNKGEYVDLELLKENESRRVTDGVVKSSSQQNVITYDGEDFNELIQMDFDLIENIKLIEENNDEYSTEEIYIDNGEVTSLPGGYYSVDYGDHWISPNDSNVIHTFAIGENTTASYSQSVTSKATHSTDFTISNKVNIPFAMMTFAMENGYGYSWSNAKTQSINVQIPSKEGYSAFSKIQAVSRRIDVIKVENSKIVGRESTYVPTGFASEKIYYETNTTADQSQLYSSKGYNILGQSDDFDISKIPTLVLLFDLRGGYGEVGSDFSPQYVLAGSNPTSPISIPKKYGHTFTGWYVDPSCSTPMIFSSWRMMQDGTVFAKWRENPKYTLSFNLNGGVGNIASQQVYQGEKPIEPTEIPMREGYEFDGWYIDSRLTRPMVFDEWEMNYNGSVFAKWNEIKNYEVNFDLNGGVGNTDAIEVREGYTLSSVKEIQSPTREGYQFMGWKTSTGVDVDVDSYTFYRNHTLVAQWKKYEYVLDFDLNGGSGVFRSQYLEHGENPIEPNQIPTKEGYIFDGWYVNSRLTIPMDFNTWEMKHSGKVFAKWSTDFFTVDFDLGFEDIVIESQIVETGGLIKKPQDPVKEGFNFLGWYSYQGARDQINFDAFRVNNDQTIFAKWENK